MYYLNTACVQMCKSDCLLFANARYPNFATDNSIHNVIVDKQEYVYFIAFGKVFSLINEIFREYSGRNAHLQQINFWKFESNVTGVNMKGLWIKCSYELFSATIDAIML